MSFLQSLPYPLHFQVDRVFFFDYYCCIHMCIQYTHICINPVVGGVHEVSRLIHCIEQPIRNHLWERLIFLLLSANQPIIAHSSLSRSGSLENSPFHANTSIDSLIFFLSPSFFLIQPFLESSVSQ